LNARTLSTRGYSEMPWIWDDRRELFVNTETGKTAPLEDMPELVDALITDAWDDLDEALAEKPEPRKVRNIVLLLLSDLYLILAALGIGGLIALDANLRAQIEEMLARQVGYLDLAISQYLAERISPAELRRRARMYLNSARSAYWTTRDEFEKRRGKVEQRWIAVGDRNTCSPCLDAERLGWVPIGTLGVPGSGIVTITPTTMCEGLTNCRCQIAYR